MRLLLLIVLTLLAIQPVQAGGIALPTEEHDNEDASWQFFERLDLKIKTAQIAKSLLQAKSEWKDSIRGQAPKPVSLFSCPKPLSDIVTMKQAWEDDRESIYLLLLHNFQNYSRLWVIDWMNDVPDQYFYGKSDKECLDQFRKAVQFKGEIFDHPSGSIECFFP